MGERDPKRMVGFGKREPCDFLSHILPQTFVKILFSSPNSSYPFSLRFILFTFKNKYITISINVKLNLILIKFWNDKN